MYKFTHTFKNTVQDFMINFKKKFRESQKKPRSKRKSFLSGFTTVLGIFGMTLLASVLPAITVDITKNTPKPGQVCPAPAPINPPLLTSAQITIGLTGAASTMCALAVSSRFFMVGGVCGIIVVVGILKAQGK
jgi:hypothetical protein